MKAHVSFRNICSFCSLITFTALLLAGCATKKADWNSRVGSYTYDQAVAQMGPPDKQAKLSDGKTVAEWLTRSGGSGLSFGMGGGSYGSRGGVGVGMSQTVGGSGGLRLTFDPEGKLASWSKN